MRFLFWFDSLGIRLANTYDQDSIRRMVYAWKRLRSTFEDGANTQIDFIGIPVRCFDFRCVVSDTHNCDSTNDAPCSISPCSQLRTSDHRPLEIFTVIIYVGGNLLIMIMKYCTTKLLLPFAQVRISTWFRLISSLRRRRSKVAPIAHAPDWLYVGSLWRNTEL